MGEVKDNSHDQSRPQTVDTDAFLDLNFVPAWARKPPDTVRASRYSDGDARKENRSRHSDRRDRSDRGAVRRPSSSRGDRSSNSRDGEQRKSVSAHTNVRPAPQGTRGHDAGRGRPDRGGHQRENEAASLLRVQFLPERKAISELAKRIGASRKAYPLLDLAHLLMAKEGLCYVRVETLDSNVTLYQCKICQMVDRDRAAIAKHITSDHISDYFAPETQTVDPPSGVFVCVAICGLSGKFLGPPNHHSYSDAVKAMHAQHYSHMSIEQYRSKIRTSHDPEDVERWKQSCTEHTVYRKKDRAEDAEEDEVFSEKDAQRFMDQTIVDRSIKEQRRVVLSESTARSVEDPAVRSSLHNAWQKELRFPIQVALALRAALRSRKLHVFKAGSGKGMHFVTSVKPESLDPDVAIPEIRDTLKYLAEHPGCTRKEVIHDLLGDLPEDHPDVKARLQPITWLVDKGHIIEFFDGRLAVPRHK